MLNRELPDRSGKHRKDPHTIWLDGIRHQIDLNCDLGEGMENDALLMPFISSANIACGYHAGDQDTMQRTVGLALAHKVAIGAHPSYPDRENFGRTDLLDNSKSSEGPWHPFLPESLPPMISDQLGILQTVCAGHGTRLHHVKLHGALYNRAARDMDVSMLICQAITKFDPSLFLYGPGGSLMEKAAVYHGLPFIREVFADRTYQEDGQLTPRTAPDALIGETAQAIAQVLTIIREGKVLSTGGKAIPLAAETICIHGDGRYALQFAPAIRQALQEEHIIVQAP